MVVEPLDLGPAGAVIKMLRLGKCAVGIQTRQPGGELAGDRLGGRHKPFCEPEATRGGGNPEPLDLLEG